MPSKPVDELPDLEKLHVRHSGLTPAICQCYSEAARVSLSRHHRSPIRLSVHDGRRQRMRGLKWRPIGDREARAWANADDATRDGAYSVSIAAVEVEHGMLAVARAETRTGADYYVDKPGATDLENAQRLEVSGISDGNAAAIRSRLQQKVNQVKAGESDLPAIACVVGFREKCVAMACVKGPSGQR